MVDKKLLTTVPDYLQKHLPNYDTQSTNAQELASFRSILGSLPSATRSDFRKQVENIDDSLIIQLADPFGAKFGLWVAQNNPSAEVRLYDPANIGNYFKFPPYLFNQLGTEEVAKLQFQTIFDPSQPEKSLNDLYKGNDLSNITYHQKAMSPELLEEIIQDANDRPVVLFADRVNTLAPMLARAAGRNDNVEAVIMPLLNGPLNGGYFPVDGKDVVNEYVDYILNDEVKDYAGSATPEKFLQLEHDENSRAYTMMNLYQAVDLARQANADVFLESNPKYGAPYHQPNFYVSTINPDMALPSQE